MSLGCLVRVEAEQSRAEQPVGEEGRKELTTVSLVYFASNPRSSYLLSGCYHCRIALDRERRGRIIDH